MLDSGSVKIILAIVAKNYPITNNKGDRKLVFYKLFPATDQLMSNTASIGRSMRIPLDYYQILGVPTAATMGQIQQAYADRNLQQPRHEYTSTAIESRRKLLGDAYEVLAHPSERSQYDASQMEANPHFPAGEQPPSSLEIPADRLLGGLLIMSEIGEYERLLTIAWPLLGSDQILQQSIGSADLEETRNSLYLTVALTLLELGREEWRQNKPAEGCQALETSIKLLRQQGVYPTVQAEINKELSKFRPQYILSLLCTADTSVENHQQALSLLQEVVSACSNPQGYKTYGMTQDGFIAYIDQIRRYLTTHEQQSLFEEPALQSGNPVFTYLLVYAMVARGFYYQMPELVHRAKQLLLKNLGRRQDVFIEQALCYLLLGQTKEAQNALERSQDRESLEYIRKNSTTSEDLLLGLCRYSELWFQSQVFPHFADLTHHKASLQGYFDNRQVQAYLDDLPPASGDLTLFNETSGELSPFANVPASVALPAFGTPSSPIFGSAPIAQSQVDLPLVERSVVTRPSIPPNAGDNVVPFERPQKKRASVPDAMFMEDSSDIDESSRLPLAEPPVGEGNLAPVESTALAHRPKSTLTRRKRWRPILLRQALIGFGGLFTAIALVIIAHNTLKTRTLIDIGNQKKISPPAAPIEKATVATLPKTSPQAEVAAATDSKLTIANAQVLVESWLQAKGKALSAQYDVAALDQILADPALARAKRRSTEAKADGAYWEHQHAVKIDAISNSPGGGMIEATVNEMSKFYTADQQLDGNHSYDKSVRVRYALVKHNGRWLIKDMTVIQ
jgi:tetratricopeptide (TPR) repeat protein